MKKILVVGQSITGAMAALEIKRRRPDWHVIFAPGSGRWPCQRERWPEALRAQEGRQDWAWQNSEMLKIRGIEVIGDREITRLNLKRRRAYFSDRSQTEFEKILLTDLPQSAAPEVRGSNKKGLYHLRREEDFQKFHKNLDLIDTATFQIKTWWGFRMAMAVADRGKDVYMVIPQSSAFWGIRSSKFADQWKSLCHQHRLNIVEDQVISELLGDADIRAVRFQQGKVVASDAVIFESLPFDYRIFSDEEIAQSNIEISAGDSAEVFRADVFDGTLTNQHYVTEYLEAEGRRVAAILTGDEPDVAARCRFSVNGNLGDARLSLVGSQPQAHWTSIEIERPVGQSFQFFCREDNRIAAALLINGAEILTRVESAVFGQEVYDAANWIIDEVTVDQAPLPADTLAGVGAGINLHEDSHYA